MFLRAAKTEAEAAGESTDGMASSVSKLREEFLNLTGNKVDIQIDENTFKSTYDILKELSEVWDELSDITQANILERIGGKRNANVSAALIEGFSIAADVAETAAEASGSALAENEKYLESIKGHIAEFQATFQQLAITLIDSGFINMVIDLGTAILNILNAIASLIDKLGGLNTVLITVLGTISVFKGGKIAKEFGDLAGRNIDKLITFAVDLKDSIRGIPQILKEAKSAFSKTTTAAATTATTVGEIATQTTTWAARLSKIAPIAFGAVGVFMALAGIVTAVYNAIKEGEEQAYQDAINRAKESREQQKELDGLIARYKEMGAAANGVWSTTEAAEVKDIQEDIANLVGTQADALDLVNGKLDTEYKKLLAIYETEAEMAALDADAAYAVAKNRYDQGYQDDSWLTSGETAATAARKAYAYLNPGGTTTEWYAEAFGLENPSNGSLEDAIKQASDLPTALNGLYTLQETMVEAIQEAEANGDEEYTNLLAAGLEQVNNYINILKEQIDDYETARQNKLEADAKSSVINYINDTGIRSEQELADYIRNVLAAEQDYDYAKILAEEMMSYFPEFELPDDVKRELITDSKKLVDDISKEIKGVDKYTAQIFLDGLDLETYSRFVSFYESVNKNNDAITESFSSLIGAFNLSEVSDALTGLADDFDKATEAAKDFSDSMDADEKDDNFRTAAEAFSTLNDEFVAGRVNSNAFWAAAKFLFGEEQLDAWGWADGIDKIREAMVKNVEVFKDADSAAEGFLTRMYSMSKSGQVFDGQGNLLGEITRNDQGGFDYAIKDFYGLADAMGLSEEAALACLEALQVFGEINFTNVEQLNNLLKQMGAATKVGGTSLFNSDTLTSQLRQLGKTDEDIVEIFDSIKEAGDTAFIGAQMGAKELIDSLLSLKVAEQNAGKIEIDYQELNRLAGLIGITDEDIQGMISKLGEIDNVAFTKQLGSGSGGVADVDDVLNHISELNTTSTETHLANIVEQFGIITDFLTDLDGKKISLVIDLKGSFQTLFDGGDEGSYISERSSFWEEQNLNAYEQNMLDAANPLLSKSPGLKYNSKPDVQPYIAATKEAAGEEAADETATGSTTRKYPDLLNDTASAADKAAEELDKMKTSLEEVLSDYEHSIFLLEKNEGSSEQIINIYQTMQSEVHKLAQQYRQKGLDENSDYIQELQKQWWEYQESINEIRQADFDNYLTDAKFSIEISKEDNASISDLTAEYSAILSAINKEIEYYSSKGYDTSDEVIQKLMQEQWNLKDEIIASLDEIVEKTNDSIDELQDVYSALTDAAEEYEKYNFISIDTLQAVVGMGVEYMALLKDENGQLVINQKSIERIIAARAEQLAVESALNYVSQIGMALQEGNTEELNRLLTATTGAAGATWDLVYANLALLNLNGEQFNAALTNINRLRSFAENAAANVSKGLDMDAFEENLDKQQSALEEILEYTMELVEWEVEKQVEALEADIESYEKIIELKKEMLDTTKDELDYEDEVAEKVKDIAKLQERITALSLDDSRDAQAEKITLEEEMNELQKELADYQADHMLETQQDTLDDMLDAYRENKEDEIAEVEATVSSTEKIYRLAIERINNDWDGLYDDLIAYNYEYGSNLESELTSAWAAASEAVQEYGSYLKAVIALENSRGDSSASGNGFWSSDDDASITQTSDSSVVRSLVSTMKSRAEAWWQTTDPDKRKSLEEANEDTADKIASILGKSVTKSNGVWYVDGKELFAEYYHTGGIAGDSPTLKQNEVMAVLEKGEAVIDEQREKALFRLIDFVSNLQDKFTNLFNGGGYRHNLQSRTEITAEDIPGIAANKHTDIHFGDVYIYGASEDTVEQHREINRQFTNDVLRHLGIKK